MNKTTSSTLECKQDSKDIGTGLHCDLHCLCWWDTNTETLDCCKCDGESYYDWLTNHGKDLILILTADYHTVKVGDTVHNYYDCKTGVILKISHGDKPNDGWAVLSNDAGFVNGERMSLTCRVCGYGL